NTAADDVDARRAPVLVAFVFLEVHEVAIVITPLKGVRQIAILGAGEGLSALRFGHRREPKVAHTVERRQVGDVLAVGTDADVDIVGVVKKNAPGRKRAFGLCGSEPAKPEEGETGKGRRAAEKPAAVERGHGLVLRLQTAYCRARARPGLSVYQLGCAQSS